MARTMIGTVVSDKMAKSCIVAVQSRKTHPLYHKQYNVTKRIAAHDEKNQSKTGDKVEIEQTSPKSRTKRWSVVKVLESASEKQS